MLYTAASTISSLNVVICTLYGICNIIYIFNGNSFVLSYMLRVLHGQARGPFVENNLPTIGMEVLVEGNILTKQNERQLFTNLWFY